MIVPIAAAELPDWIVWATSIATIIIAVALVITSIAFVGIALAARKMVGRVNSLVGRVQEGALPMLHHGQDVAENINYISTSVREDVQRLKGTLLTAQTKLEHAAETTERRIGEFNALLEVVQEEAEAIFVSTASTVRGVQAGADRLRALRASDGADENDAREEQGIPPLGTRTER